MFDFLQKGSRVDVSSEALGQAEKAKRLPPGQHLTDKFPVLHYGSIPNFNEASTDTPCA